MGGWQAPNPLNREAGAANFCVFQKVRCSAPGRRIKSNPERKPGPPAVSRPACETLARHCGKNSSHRLKSGKSHTRKSVAVTGQTAFWETTLVALLPSTF